MIILCLLVSSLFGIVNFATAQDWKHCFLHKFDGGLNLEDEDYHHQLKAFYSDTTHRRLLFYTHQYVVSHLFDVFFISDSLLRVRVYRRGVLVQKKKWKLNNSIRLSNKQIGDFMLLKEIKSSHPRSILFSYQNKGQSLFLFCSDGGDLTQCSNSPHWEVVNPVIGIIEKILELL